MAREILHGVLARNRGMVLNGLGIDIETDVFNFLRRRTMRARDSLSEPVCGGGR